MKRCPACSLSTQPEKCIATINDYYCETLHRIENTQMKSTRASAATNYRRYKTQTHGLPNNDSLPIKPLLDSSIDKEVLRIRFLSNKQGRFSLGLCALKHYTQYPALTYFFSSSSSIFARTSPRFPSVTPTTTFQMRQTSSSFASPTSPSVNPPHRRSIFPTSSS